MVIGNFGKVDVGELVFFCYVVCIGDFDVVLISDGIFLLLIIIMFINVNEVDCNVWFDNCFL